MVWSYQGFSTSYTGLPESTSSFTLDLLGDSQQLTEKSPIFGKCCSHFTLNIDHIYFNGVLLLLCSRTNSESQCGKVIHKNQWGEREIRFFWISRFPHWFFMYYFSALTFRVRPLRLYRGNPIEFFTQMEADFQKKIAVGASIRIFLAFRICINFYSTLKIEPASPRGSWVPLGADFCVFGHFFVGKNLTIPGQRQGLVSICVT